MRGGLLDELLATSVEGETLLEPAAVGNATVTRTSRSGQELRVDVVRTACPGAGEDGRAVGFIDAAQLSSDVGAASDAEHRARRVIEEMGTAVLTIGVGAVLDELRHRSLDDAGMAGAADDIDDRLAGELLAMAELEDCNRAARELLPPGSTTAAHRLSEFWSEDAGREFLRMLLELLTGRRRVSADLDVRGRDGGLIACEATAHLICGPGGRDRMILCLNDVTELKRAVEQSEQSREYYRVIFDMMPIALYRIDGSAAAGLAVELMAIPEDEREPYLVAHPEKVESMASRSVMAAVNRQGATLLRSSKEALTGQAILPVWTRRMDTYRRSLVARLGNEFFEEETQIVVCDGEVVDVLFAMAPVAHAGERFTIVGMVDLSELKRTEANLSRLQADFAHAARIASLGELTASLAHEVSQPLSAIHLCAETASRWLDRKLPDIEATRSQLTRINSHAQRATSVIERVRGMALAGGSKKRQQDLVGVVADALALIAPQARAMRIALRFSPPRVTMPILGDRVEIEQVVVNLIVNALQAIENGGCRDREITVSLGQEGTSARCEISDTGPGVADADLHRLFERFFTTKSNGMGLGLAICRTIVEAHDGSIEVFNRTGGVGATFLLSFPLDPRT